MQLVKDKKVVITGGTSGIGKAIAIAFAKHSAHVAIFGTSTERGKEVLSLLEKEKQSEAQKFYFSSVDVSNHVQVSECMDALFQQWGGIDVLINCAGITRDRLLLRMTEEDWDSVINTNLKSVYNLCKSAIKPMIKNRSGKIINITSVIGLTGNAGQSNYAASKAGMVGFTKSLACELAKKNICVNAIAPGFIKTPMTDKLTDEQKEDILSKIPMGKWGEPEDIANAALFLASALADYITGQVITVDGGMLA
jgi:3-oxoacyl-[acyl-carrier protein] reductase